MIETGGWDTHSAQNQRLGAQLKALDTMMASMRDRLGEHWANTTVLVATEFGRTAAANGTGGTDHGTASAAMLLGGAVKAVGCLPTGRDCRPQRCIKGGIYGRHSGWTVLSRMWRVKHLVWIRHKSGGSYLQKRPRRECQRVCYALSVTSGIGNPAGDCLKCLSGSAFISCFAAYLILFYYAFLLPTQNLTTPCDFVHPAAS